MMTLVETELIGCVRRKQIRPRKIDRKAAVSYGRPLRNRHRKEPSPGQWVPSLMATWALDQDCFIGQSIRDDKSDLNLLPHQRPGLVKLCALATGSLPGGILIESPRDLGTLGQAVLGKFWLRLKNSHDTGLWYGDGWDRTNRAKAHAVTEHEVARWVRDAGQNAVEQELANLDAAFRQALQLEGDGVTDFWTYLGSGPMRDAELARQEYQRLGADNTDEDILRYLNIYGYTNPRGTVGRWYHANLQSLRASRNT